VASALLLSTYRRRPEIGIMRAMGASQRFVVLVFVLQGALIGLMGGLLGAALGYLALLPFPAGGQFRTGSLPIDIRQGTLIDYKLKMRGFPVKWRTEISVWYPPYRFVDQQLRGPYRQWIHTHTFTELEPSKTLIEDEVRYRLPFEPLGDFAHFFVARELKYIFDYRQKAVSEILRRKI
jgi:ligand-binding SRPBCC domain-containing protein